jgi:transcriptional regulator with GAF, ATPase, and Fis domain/ligand-binding sensor domain-containing protein
MWFAADGSVMRYNGSEYKRFGAEEGSVEGLVTGITEDRAGNMWFAFDRGVARVSKDNKRNWILSQSEDRYGVFADSYGRVWAYKTAFPGDVFVFTGGSLQNFSQQFNFKNQVILNMAEDSTGGIWFLTRNSRLYKLLGSEIKEVGASVINRSSPRGCFFDWSNNLVVFMREGVAISAIRNLHDEKSWTWLLDESAQCGIPSRRGVYWFATDKGDLVRLSPQSPAGEKASLRITERNGLDFHNMYGLFEDAEGNLWIGDDLKGIGKIASLAFATFGKEEGLQDDVIVSSTRLNSTLYLGTEKGLYLFDGKSFHKKGSIDPPVNRTIFAMFASPSNSILLGSVPGLYEYASGKQITSLGLDKLVIQAIVRAPNGEFWLGTHKGIYRLENVRRTPTVEPLLANASIKQLVVYGHESILARDEADVWMIENAMSSTGQSIHPIPRPEQQGTTKLSDVVVGGHGDIIVSTEQGVFVIDTLGHWQLIHGPQSAKSSVLYADSRRRIWIGEDRMLHRYEKVDNRYHCSGSYTYPNMARFFTVSEDEQGKLYFGTRGGLVVYDPNEEQSVGVVPLCNISALFVNDSIVMSAPGVPVELKSGNRVRVSSEGLSFCNEDALRFEHYLAPVEKPWSRSSTQPDIDLGYLEPNEYTFFVRVVTPLGVTSAPDSVSLVVLGPVWKRPWAVGIMILTLAIVGYSAHRLRQSQIRKRNIHLEKVVSEKTRALEESKFQIESQYSQLLNAQQELVGKKELERAYEEIQLLKNRLDTENIYLKEKQGRVEEVGSVIGRSRAIQEVRKKILEVAPTESTVLLMGETGVGKNLVAEAIHGLSSRNNRALVTVNCAAIPDSLVESELFGHEKGAFTGASACRVGKFEVADGSTIFLDEIGDMNLAVQAKILNVLQSRQFSRVGGNNNKVVDVRVIAATNHDLNDLVRKGRFRQDLLYRINVYVIDIPPLRERKEDVELLAKFFIDRYAKTLKKRIHAVTKSALDVLEAYPYPGNIRELENIIHRSVIICKGETISDQDILVNVESLSKGVLDNGERDSFVTLEGMEKRHILRALEQANWKISGPSGAAERLGLHHNTLRHRMQKLGIPFHPEENGSKPPSHS